MPFEDFTITKARGTAVTLGLVVKTGTTPLDITGWTALEVWAKATLTARDSDAIVKLALGTGVTRAVGTAGVATAVIPAESSQALPNREKTLYVEVRGADAGGVAYSLSRGNVKFTPVTVSAPVFKPTSIPGLKGWLKGDLSVYKDATLSQLAAVDLDGVGGWKGAGGNTRAFIQGKSVKQPTRRLATLNALATVRGDGVDDFLQGPKLSTFITPSDCTVFIVGRATVGAAGTDVDAWPAFFSDQAQGFVIGVGATQVGISNTTAVGRDQAKANMTLNTWGVIEARHGGGNIGIRVNGGTEVTAASGNTLPTLGGTTLNIPASIFGALGAPAFLAGDIAELLIWNVHLTDPQKAGVRTYLSQRWGIPAFNATVTPS